MSNLELAKRKCAEAERCLHSARKLNNSKTLITKAIDLYNEVLMMEDIELPDPYIGISYLAFSAGDKPKAIGLLMTAKQIAPADMRVDLMMQRLEKASLAAFPDQASPTLQRLEKMRDKNPHLDLGLEAHFEVSSAQLATDLLEEVVEEPTVLSLPEPEPEPKEDPQPKRLSSELGPKELGKRCEGPPVELLQRILIQFDKRQTKVTVTGTFDKVTGNAVRAFQMQQKLPITGWVDVKTGKLLNRMLQEMMAQYPEQSIWDLSTEAEMLVIPADATQLLVDLGQFGQSDVISEGPQIRLLQKALFKLGYDRLGPGEVFDKTVFAAVRNVQMTHKISITGMVDQKTRDVLNPVLQLLEEEEHTLQCLMEISQAYRDSLGQEVHEELKMTLFGLLQQLIRVAQEPHPESDALSDTPMIVRELIHSTLGTMGQMGIVSQGPEVERLQETLLAEGYQVKVNGVFDLQTFSELKAYQQEHGFNPSGTLEGPSREAINQRLQWRYNLEETRDNLWQEISAFCEHAGLAVPKLHHERLQRLVENVLRVLQDLPIEEEMLGDANGEPPELHSELGPSGRPGKLSKGPEVRLLQNLLRQLGYEQIELSEKYDDATYAAVRSLQMAHKLPMTGMVDSKTRDLLNQKLKELVSPVEE